MRKQRIQNLAVKAVFYGAVIAGALLAMSLSSWAQLQPPLSPWLEMSGRGRATSGSLGPYLSSVRPQQNMMRAFAAQASQIQRQQRQIQSAREAYIPGNTDGSNGNLMSMDYPSVEGIVTGESLKNKILQPPREIPSQKAPTTYNQYLHYYPQGSLSRRPVPNFSTAGRR